MNDLTTPSRFAPSTDNILEMVLFEPARMNALQSFAEIMSKGGVAIPKHLLQKPADCFAVVLQALRWKFDPYEVARKSYIDPTGRLSYESQLINSVITKSGTLEGRPEYEYLGDWDKILGRIVEKVGQQGGKYYAADWKKDDEVGLGVIVRATIVGESKPREVRVMMSQAWPRFSTQWATDPQQQLSYLALRKFVRRYIPDALMGVNTAEDLVADDPTGEFEVVDETATRGPKRKSDKPLPMVDEVTPTPAAAAEKTAETVDRDTGEIKKTEAADKPAKARDPAPASAGSVEQITTSQVAYLRKKLGSAGVPEDSICHRFQVASIELLSSEQFEEIRAELVQNA